MTAAPDLPFVLRDATDSDLAFVKHSWRQTFFLGGFGCAVPEARRGGEGRRSIPPPRDHYHAEMGRVMDRIFARGGRAVLAVDTKDPDVIIGFAVYTGPELHFVYVRNDFRKMGVANLLLSSIQIRRFTFLTHLGNEAIRPLKRGWDYTPRWTL